MQSLKSTIEAEEVSPSKKMTKLSNQSEILKIQAEVRKRKKVIEMQTQFKKNKQEFNKIAQEIESYQQELQIKKRQAINRNMQQFQAKKAERQRKNKESNRVLNKIKEGNRERRQRMQSLVHQYKQEYEYVYKKKLSQRKAINQVKFEDILEHQREYQKSLRKRSQRIKTQSEVNSKRTQRKLSPSNVFFGSPIKQGSYKSEQEQLRKEKMMDLINRRNEYGNRMQKQAPHVRISTTLVKRVKDDRNKIQYDKEMDYYQKQQKKWRKARLDTNLTGDIESIKNQQINIIANEEVSTKDKINKLKHLVDGLNLRYVNGKEDVLDQMCNASLARANLLLHQS